MRLLVATVVVWCCTTTASPAQTFDGYASIFLDALPNLDTTELRPRVFADYRQDAGARIRFTIAGFVEGLVRDRGENEVERDAIVRPQELHVESRWQHADLRVGFSRIVWGRLDEFQPTDVVNPQDLTRFFLEGRTEGRLPVAMIRGRWIPSDSFSLEAVYVPIFRRGRFDQLDEDSSPFNVTSPIPATRLEPAHTLQNAQGGMRASVTTGRVDWAISAYRGFEAFPIFLPAPPARPASPTLQATFPRFTMVGGDFETVKGLWGVRGEVAVFPNRTLQQPNALDAVDGTSAEAGVGVDRKAGNYRVSGTVMFTVRPDRHDVMLVSSVDRSFARETRSVRAFAVYNPREDSAFARVIAAASLRDNVSLEGSVGWFGGSGVDVLSRFSRRDFLYARFKVFF